MEADKMRPIYKKAKSRKLMQQALRTRKIAQEHAGIEKALREGKSPDSRGADSFGRIAKAIRKQALEEARHAKSQKPIVGVAVQKLKRTTKKISKTKYSFKI